VVNRQLQKLKRKFENRGVSTTINLMPKKNSHFKRNYFILFFVSLALIFVSFHFRGEIAKLGSFGLLGIFLINLVGSMVLFLPAPSLITVVAGGFVYNPFVVALVAALGTAIGDFVAYILGRSGKEVLLKKDSFWYGIFKETFHKFGAIFIIFFSFIPNPLFDAIGLVAGLFSYSPVRFVIYVFIGRFLRNLLLAYLGHAITPQ
jgi:membrane protein YqaA with SNARE-associated domain